MLLRALIVSLGTCAYTTVVKDLGVTLDSHLSFVPHVNNTCCVLSRSFHSIGRFRKFLSQADTHCSCALSVSRVSKCMGLYGNLTQFLNLK